MKVMLLYLLILAVFALISILALRLLFRFGAPYVPSNKDRLKAILELAGNIHGKRILDLGAGDGRIVLACAQAGAQAHGYEINPILARRAMKNIAKANLNNRAHIHQKNYWHVNTREYDIIVVYGISTIMKALEKKLQREMTDHAKVISVYFPFPTWAKTCSVRDVHLYEKPALETMGHRV